MALVDVSLVARFLYIHVHQVERQHVFELFNDGTCQLLSPGFAVECSRHHGSHNFYVQDRKFLAQFHYDADLTKLHHMIFKPVGLATQYFGMVAYVGYHTSNQRTPVCVLLHGLQQSKL